MTKPITERELVLGILLEVTRDGEYSHIALRNVLSKYQYLDKKERAFITRVTEGTLEHMIEIDYIINQYSKTKVNKMKPVIRSIVRSAVYQLKYMDSVPNSAAVNEAVKLAVKKGFTGLRGFVNGLLRNIDRNLSEVKYPKQGTLEALSIHYSMPEWILKQWQKIYDEDKLECILQSFLEDAPTTIRCNVQQIAVDALIKKLETEGVNVVQHPYLPYALMISGYDYLGALKSFQGGDFQVQDLSSMLVAEVAKPSTGDYIIDVCAAPGGKALHLAEKLQGTGMVEARDLTEYKITYINENIARMGLHNIKAVCMDATVLDAEAIEKADIVIADLPCSGLGVLGKKTDLKYKMTEEVQAELAVLQRNILSVVMQYVKPGGTLVYSTCTINEEENESNARWFLEQYKEFKPAPFQECLCEALKGCVTEEGTLQLLPGVHQSDGFFIARFRKEIHE